MKTDWRASLSTGVLNHLLTVIIEGDSLEQYNVDRAVHLWWTNDQRQRRPQFIQPNDDDDNEDELLNYLMLHSQNATS